MPLSLLSSAPNYGAQSLAFLRVSCSPIVASSSQDQRPTSLDASLVYRPRRLLISTSCVAQSQEGNRRLLPLYRLAACNVSTPHAARPVIERSGLVYLICSFADCVTFPILLRMLLRFCPVAISINAAAAPIQTRIKQYSTTDCPSWSRIKDFTVRCFLGHFEVSVIGH